MRIYCRYSHYCTTVEEMTAPHAKKTTTKQKVAIQTNSSKAFDAVVVKSVVVRLPLIYKKLCDTLLQTLKTDTAICPVRQNISVDAPVMTVPLMHLMCPVCHM